MLPAMSSHLEMASRGGGGYVLHGLLVKVRVGYGMVGHGMVWYGMRCLSYLGRPPPLGPRRPSRPPDPR